MFIDKLDNKVIKYNNALHGTIKMKPVVVKTSTELYFNQENNKEGPKFNVSDHVRISKYKSIFTKGCVPNWSEEVFVIKKVRNTVSWTYFFRDLKGEKIVGRLQKFQKSNQNEFRVQ